ncbi:MAG: hypothetical protein ACREQ4_12950, partial [Candidatus Binataceae bacterium]
SKHTGLPDPRVKDALHEFEAVGVGRYVPGRWHNSNRFEFSRKLNEIAAVATGERGDFADDVDDDIDVANSSGPPMVEQLLSNAEANGAGRNGAVTLSFQIAGGLEPSIRVPTKLTRKDAESLVAFVKSLPFDASA